MGEGIASGRWTIWLAEADGEIASHAYIGLIDKIPRPTRGSRWLGYVTNVYTRPEQRGRGIGTALLEQVTAWAVEHDIELLVVWPSEESVGFYERAGFVSGRDPLVWMADERAHRRRRRGTGGARGRAARRRARDDARRARVPGARRRRGRARERGGGAWGRGRARDDRGARRTRSASASTEDELARFTPEARKLGPRDLAACAVQGDVGATTVGGALAVADASGIRFLGTGGIGGVHRGFPTPARRVGRYPRARSSPGRSSSVGREVAARRARRRSELLETLGVPVLGFRTDTLPLFYSADGGPPVPAASRRRRRGRAHRRRPTGSWAAAASCSRNPPAESLDVEDLIEEAVAAAAPQGVSGQAVTPFVLAFLHERSGGRTLEVNRAADRRQRAAGGRGRGSVRRVVSLYDARPRPAPRDREL